MTVRWESGAALRAGAVVPPLPEAIAGRVDPYLVWAGASRWTRPTDWVPVLIELHGVAAHEFAAHARIHWQGWMRVAPWYLKPAAGLGSARHLTAWVLVEGFAAALAGPDHRLAGWVERFAIGRASATPPRALGDPPADAPFTAPGTVPAGVAGAAIVGVIDDGIAFAHGRLLAADGAPRVRWFWDQRDASPQPAFVPNAPVPRGVEWPAAPQGANPASLQALLDGHRHAGLVDEDALYRAAGQRQAGAHSRHGTLVLDLAAGGDAHPGGPSWPVVAVQLPEAVADDPGGTLLEPQLLDALRYVVDRADRVAESLGATGPMPLVVNLSYGVTAGPHDGSSLLEAAMDDLVAQREAIGAPLAIVVAAGNSARSRMHARLALAAGETRTLRWRIPADGRTPAFLELWVGHPQPGQDPARVSVRLVPPVPVDGAVPDVGPGDYAWLVDDAPIDPAEATDADRTLATVSSLAVGEGEAGGLGHWNDRDMVLLAVAPTAGHDARRSWAPHGPWTVELTHLGGAPVEVHGWIRRNDVPYGTRAQGRQSWFERPRESDEDASGRPIEVDLDPYDGPVDARSTLNGIATGRRTIVVGAGRADRHAPTPYTSLGPAIAQAAMQATHRAGPDLLAPADDSAARPGVPAAGTRTGSVAMPNGSSVAAPAVARAIAAAFAQGAAATTGDALQAVSAPWKTAGADGDRRGEGWAAADAAGRPPR